MVKENTHNLVHLSENTLNKIREINLEFDIKEKDMDSTIDIICDILLDLDNIMDKESNKIRKILENLFDLIQNESLEYSNSEIYAEALSIYDNLFNSSIFQKKIETNKDE